MYFARTQILVSLVRRSITSFVFFLLISSCFSSNSFGAQKGVENIRWVVMTQSDWFYHIEPSTVFQDLKGIGVDAVIDGIPWMIVEPSDGNLNFTFVRDSMNAAQAAGLIWIPHIAIHYAPGWLMNSDVNYHWIKKNGSYSQFDNVANPPNIFHPQTLFYVDRFINAFFDEFSDQNFVLIYLSTGSLGETYYPEGYDYCAFDANTKAAWKSFTGNSSAIPYSGPNANDGTGASHAVFIDWWYNQMYAYMDHIYSLANSRMSSAAFGLKVSHFAGIGQVMEEQVQTVLPYGLKVISFGGPLAFTGSDAIQKLVAVAELNNINAWIESSLTLYNGIDQTPVWTKDKIIEYSLDGYLYSTMGGLFSGFLAVPPFQKKDEFYKYKDLIALFSSGECPACSGDIVLLENMKFLSGTTCVCIAKTSMTIGPGVTVDGGANVTFKAPIIHLKDGFNAKASSIVRIMQE